MKLFSTLKSVAAALAGIRHKKTSPAESSGCSHACGSCGNTGCGERSASPSDMRIRLHPFSKVRKVIGVVSGKGGVGKSLVTAMLAAKMQARGCHAAVLDADITGPSIPRLFGVTEHVVSTEIGLKPSRSATGVDMVSMNLLLENETDPVTWRGAVVTRCITQFWKDFIWNHVEYMFVDMPPGTGDVPITVYQTMPVDAIVVVTSPQELVSMIVEKAVKMAQSEGFDIPIIGLVENMSYFECDCGSRHSIYGESQLEKTAEKHGIRHTARIPIDPSIAAACDAGKIESLPSPWLDDIADAIQKL